MTYAYDTVLIDADIVAYRESAMCEKDAFGEVFVDPEKAFRGADKTILEWQLACNAENVVMVFSPRDRSNFRKAEVMGAQYKAGRVEKPIAYWDVYDYIAENYTNISIQGLEADDVLGILHTAEKRPYGTTVVASIDKDLRTIPGALYAPHQMSYPEVINPYEAAYFWMTQAICGDPVDGYSGVKGIGPVKCREALAHLAPGPFNEPPEGFPELLCHPNEPNGEGTVSENIPEVVFRYEKELFSVLVDLFRAKGEESPDHVTQALTQTRLARILHRKDYDKENNRIKLWHPTDTVYMDLATFTIT